jgi:phenylacetate-coenzyme A ligase PaaK-like adenylate-forming protein
VILIRKLRAKSIDRLTQEQKSFYEKERSRESVLEWQLSQFNQLWPSVLKNVPYYQMLAAKKKLPVSFSSWDEFKEKIPFMDRQTLKNQAANLTNRIKPVEDWRMTGGSTGEPLRIPIWKSEEKYAAADFWYSRSWFGITPADKLFLLWGHSHLLGRGLTGWWNGRIRILKDFLFGYYRHSAYDLSTTSLRKAAEAILKFRPAYLLGYAAALDLFARANQDFEKEFHTLRLKAVIATAESFPNPEGRSFISKVLGCPVIMEYGAVETGPLAHERSLEEYSVFSRHYFLEGISSTEAMGAYEVMATSLFPRCLPLIRYRLGDLIFPNSKDGINQGFKSVLGRSNEAVSLSDGTLVHSEAFAHALRACRSIMGYQIVQTNGKIAVNYLSQIQMEEKEILEIHRRLRTIHPLLEKTSLNRVHSLEKTPAGKTKRVSFSLK